MKILIPLVETSNEIFFIHFVLRTAFYSQGIGRI